jgi:osmotically-inducible protein OsmY
MRKTLFVTVVLAPVLAGCVELAAVGLGAAAISVEDRRTTGSQIEDEGIELRAGNRIGERFADKVHVNVTSFNRAVLLTGVAPDARARDEIGKIVASVQNVRAVTNEIQVAGIASLASRSNDAFITSKVKARFFDGSRFSPVHVKVVTEAAVVYLVGLVTEKEASYAVELARTTGGVRKVVKVFEYCRPTDAVCVPPRPPAGGEAKPKPAS